MMARLSDQVTRLETDMASTKTEIHTEKSTGPNDLGKVWEFFKNFVHTEARNHFKHVNLQESINVREKMDAMDWLVRHIAFISANVAFELIDKFRHMLVEGTEIKHTIVYTRHSSDVMFNIIESIKSRVSIEMVDP
jgi:hypothetical protein